MPSIINEDLQDPGTHALVIGVSHYPHISDGSQPTTNGESFNLGQLSSASRSASEFASWLLKDYHHPTSKLKSLRVLLSPSPGEQIHSVIKPLLPVLPEKFSATRANVTEELRGFKAACDSHAENIAMVYVAGHGVQMTKHGAILLLQDFAADGQLNLLDGAIDMAGVHAGMNHPGTAQTQFWFVDTCRQKPLIASRFESLTGALNIDEPNGQALVSPLFLAATTDSAAYGKPGGVSLFSEALSWALKDAGAAQGPNNSSDAWNVSVTGLIDFLPDKVKELAEQHNEEQSVDIAGKVHNALFHQYADPPKVQLNIYLSPQAAEPKSTWTILNNDFNIVFANQSQWPIVEKVDAGLYQFKVSTVNPFVPKVALLDVKPPSHNQSIEVDA
jgi:Caspase domain